MRFKQMAYVLALLLPVQTWAAESFKSEADTLNMCRQVGELMNQKTLNFDQAANLIEPYWILPKEELQSLRYNAKQLLDIMNERHGGAVDVIHAKTNRVANDTLIQHSFLLKREKHALILNCTFYRPHHTWLLNSLNWHDAPNILFD